MTVNDQNINTFEETVLEPLIYVGIEYQKVD